MNNIDNLFKSSLDGYVEAPPPAVWDALERRLEEGKKRRVFPYRWLWFFSAVSFIVLIGTSLAWKTMDDSHPVSTANSVPAIPATVATAQPDKMESAHTAADQPSAVPAPAATSPVAAASTVAHHRSAHHATVAQPVTTSTLLTNEDATTAPAPVAAQPVALTVTRRKHNNMIVEDTHPVTDAVASTPVQAVPATTDVRTAKNAKNVMMHAYAPEADRTVSHIAEAGPEIPETYHEPVTPVVKQMATGIASRPAASVKSPGKKAVAATLANRRGKAVKKAQAQRSGSLDIPVASAGRKLVRHQAIAQHGTTAQVSTSSSQQQIAATAVPASAADTSAAVNEPVASAPARKASGKRPAHKSAAPAATPGSITDGSAHEDAATAKANTGKKKAAAVQPAIVATSATGAKKPEAATETPSAGAMAPALARNKAKGQKGSSKKEVAGGSPIVAASPATATTKPSRAHVRKVHITTVAVPDADPIATSGSKAKHTPRPEHESVVSAAAKPAKDVSATVKAPAEANSATVHKATVKKVGSDQVAESKMAASAATKHNRSARQHSPKATDMANATRVAEPGGLPATAKSGKKTEAPMHQNDGKATTAKQGKHNDNMLAASATDPLAAKNIARVNKARKGHANGSGNGNLSGMQVTASRIGKPATHAKGAGKPSASVPVSAAPAIVAASHKSPFNNYIFNAAEDEPVIDEKLIVGSEKTDAGKKIDQVLPGTFKPEVLAATTTSPDSTAVAAATDSSRRSFMSHLSWGIKGGIESGFGAGTAKKGVFSTYVAYNLAPRWSVVLQPTIKVASVAGRSLPGSQSFYKANGDSSRTVTDSIPVFIIGSGGHNDTIGWGTTYRYSQSHDSIVKSYNVGGTYIEAEMPLLLRFKINSHLSVYGGPNFVYGRYVATREKTATINVMSSKNYTQINPIGTAPTLVPIDSVLKMSGTPYTQYGGPLYPNSTSSLLRIGYMLGFSYEFNKRWMVDVLMQQTPTQTRTVGGYNANTALSAPYFRFTLGYQLKK